MNINNKKLLDYQVHMDKKMLDKHSNMTKNDCLLAATELENEEMKMWYFGNTDEGTGQHDGMRSYSFNLGDRVKYFRLLAETK